jgi:hypothetical protein
MSKNEKIRLATIMKVPRIGNVAYVRIQHPAKTYPADGDDLKKRLWEIPSRRVIVKWLLKILATFGTIASWGVYTWVWLRGVRELVEVFLWLLGTAIIIWLLRELLLCIDEGWVR